MDDLISRQQAIDKFQSWIDSLDPNSRLYNADVSLLRRCIVELKKLPSAEPEQRWIPCDEQLPEEEYVLISKKPTKLSGSKWCVAIAIRMADPRSGKIQWRDSSFGVIQDDKVLAWMPLPERYLG